MKQNTTNRTDFKSIFKYFIWAIISALIFSALTNVYYINVMQKNTRSQYTQELSNLSSDIETIFTETNHTMSFFALSEDLDLVLNDATSVKYTNFTIIGNALEALQRFKNTRAFYDDAVVLRKSDNIALMTQGTSTVDEFFEYRWHSDVYSKLDWLNFTKSTQKYIVLKPTIITNTASTQKSHVIPTIQFATKDKIFSVPVIVTIKLDHVQSLLEQKKLTDNSLVYIYDKRGTFVAKTTSSLEELLSREDMIRFAMSEKESSFITTLQGTRYLIVRHNGNYGNYVYCAIVPYEDFIRESFSILMMPLLILITALIFVTIVAYVLSKKIYNPIQMILNDNARLKEDLTMAVPYVCERYLISIFNENKIMNEEDVKNFLADYDITFPNSHFIVVQSILNFNEDFFQAHTRLEYNTICQNSLVTASEAFADQMYSYVFTVAANQICIILNLDKEVLKADLMAAIQDYHKSIDTRPDMVTVHSGIGRIYEGLIGLQKSYKESLNASSQLTYMTSSMIRTYSKTDDLMTKSVYTIEDENKLVNYLLKGDGDMVFSHFNTIIDRNVQSNIGLHSLKELYLQLYNTAVRVLTTKEVSVYDIMGDRYMDISSNMGQLQPDQLHDYIRLLYQQVISYNESTNTRYDIANLKQYIDDHYDTDIYLDAIAEHFGKSPKYMSSFIKKSLGTTFQDYVSSLRINRAKELLLETSMSVNDIALTVGFNSRHPFIRKFKILEGVTPTEYRKLHK